MFNDEELDYVPCRKAIGEFNLIKLPRGDEFSHTEFKAINTYGRAKQRGWQAKPDPQEEHSKKEEKLLATPVEE